MTDLNRKENSPIMRLRNEWGRMLEEEELKPESRAELIKTCKNEIKRLDDFLDKLELSK